MLKRIIQSCFFIIGGTLGVFLMPALLLGPLNLVDHALINNPYVTAILGAVIFYALSFWLIDYVVNFVKWVEDKLIKTPVTDILFGTLGLIIGLIVAFLLGVPINNFKIPFIDPVIPILLTLIIGYLGFQVGFKKRDELIQLFSRTGTSKKQVDINGQVLTLEQPVSKRHKILDTSVIIDGRIADICQTGFLDGEIVIPQFVLGELQHIADSSDALKRNRGRRGLDILKRIQRDIPIQVTIYEGDFEEIQEVDSKLVKLAKLLNGIVVTNDFNLNKVCDLQDVQVLNINDLANAVKPVVLPGEELHVQMIKDGKEHNQGIAYLDDGTMIVVEDGKNYIGKHIDVIVTSVLQTSAGRMIFAKPKAYGKAL
ncbi:PIN/TRAM domain-containing protein [Jeotgalibacillus marinus]|uniref:PIN/TRAM domain-containing protein n=1 Tax=Jeotgalibacillus marinus TaxID=86667 RepID=A0ABV3Q5R7_9BACL